MGHVGPEMAIEWEVSKSKTKRLHLIDVELDMNLFFAQRMGDAFAEGFGGVWKGEEDVGHDLNGKEFVACESVEANRPFMRIAHLVECGELISAGVSLKTHVGWTRGKLPKQRRARMIIGEAVREEEFFCERLSA